MSLQVVTNINVDFYDKKYILINAKQYDSSSRWITITCYNQGDILNLNANEHVAYIRYKKADGNGVLNSCRINYKGEVLVELTEQMLAADGICYVDLIIVNKGSAIVDIDTGEIITVDGSTILSTMAFCVNVYETSFDNSLVESSYEFNALNELLQKAEADYSEIIQLAKSYAVGDAGGIRENEDNDNSKYYCQLALESANNASKSETNAATSEANALTSANKAKTSEINASSSATSATASATNAETSETAAKGYATTAQNSMNSAVNSASSASTSATNAYNYYLQVEAITNGLNGAFLPMGTIQFSELATLKDSGAIAAGYLYNISDNFVTDDTFKVGAGIEYTAGTNVYYTADGYWDCLAGATVTGVKGANEISYRKGNVDITAENVGAIPSSNIATVDEMKSYLGI